LIAGIALRSSSGRRRKCEKSPALFGARGEGLRPWEDVQQL
jgi:hypothetical protein